MHRPRAVNRRHIAIGGVLFLAVLGGCTTLFGGAVIEEFSVEVIMNDDFAGDVPSGGDRTCTSVGAPPDQVVLVLDVAVDDRRSGTAATTRTYEVVVGFGDQTARRTLRVADGGYERVRPFVTLPDTERYAPGDRATVNVSLGAGDDVLDTATRTTTVTEQNLTCVDPSE